MDESLQDLENELKRLRPRRPAAGLADRIDRELHPANAPSAAATGSLETLAAPVSRLTWRWPLAAAAVLAGGFFLGHQTARPPAVVSTPPAVAVRPPQTEPPAAIVAANNPEPAPAARTDLYRPVGAANVLYDLKDEGTVAIGGNITGHRVRYRYVDTYTWKNPATRASLKWSVPREEVRVIPASLN